jgi:drug/metabolite transporter (DMT)-like permease
MSHRTSFYSAMISGVLGSAMAFLIFNMASEHVEARQTALTLNLIPVIAIALGALLGRGIPSAIQLAGSAVVLVSLFFLESSEIEQ